MAKNMIIMKAQHAVAEAMLAFHQQLAATFRGDVLAIRKTHAEAVQATQEAVAAARELMQPKQEAK